MPGDPKTLHNESFRTPYGKVSDSTPKNDKNLESSIVTKNIISNPIKVSINQINSTSEDRTPDRPLNRTFSTEEILDQHLEKSISKAATLDLKLDENFSKMEILEGNMDKLLKRAQNLDLKLYRSLCLVDITSKMLTGKSDILSQKDYDRPLEIGIPEHKPIMIDKDLVGPIRENYENMKCLTIKAYFVHLYMAQKIFSRRNFN